MYIEELILIIVTFVGIYLYRNYKGQNISKFFTENIQEVYNNMPHILIKQLEKKQNN